MSSKSICFIIVYFGKFPEYIKIFLEGCKRNKDIHWIIFHDIKENIVTPENVKIIYISKKQLIELIKDKTGFCAKITTPYKLVDFKPIYGDIFEEYLINYDFWGITDIDIIYGSIRTFITNNILKKYDIITSYKAFIAGHFTIFRNIRTINKLYLKDPVVKTVIESANSRISTYDERSFDLLTKEYEEKKKISVLRKDMVLTCNDERWYFEWYTNNVKSHQEYYSNLDNINKPLINKRMKKRDYGFAYLNHGRIFHPISNKEYLYFHFMEWKKEIKIYSNIGKDHDNLYIDKQGIYILTGSVYLDRIIIYLLYLYHKIIKIR